MSPTADKLPNRVEKLFAKILRSQARFCELHPQTGVTLHGASESGAFLPLRVYTTVAVKLRRGGSEKRPRVNIAGVRQVAWRVILGTEASEVIAATEIDTRRKQGGYHQLQYGDAARHVYETSRRIQRKKGSQPLKYSLRLLQLPSVYFSALWLRRTGSEDLFFSLVNVGTKIRSGQMYRRSAVERALGEEFLRRQKARDVLAARKRVSGLRVDQVPVRRAGRKPAGDSQ
jgi:hypothetical protein